MTRTNISRLKGCLLEMFGILLCGTGLCFAIIFAVMIFSDEDTIAKEKREVATKMEEMKSALTAAKVPIEQIPGLLRIHKSALIVEKTHEHFILLSFFILSSLWLASTGWTVVLWARLRALIRAQKQLGQSPPTSVPEPTSTAGAL